MQGDGKVLLDELEKLKAKQRSHWEEYNATLPNILPKAFGLIHARAAWDIDFAKRLVFDHFELEGFVSRDSPGDQIVKAVQVCLTFLSEDLDDPFDPTPEDWERIEKVAGL